jgi:tRNA(Ile)-lysidine synthase
MQLIEKFYKELNQVKLKLPFTKILVAVSGGIDSLALCFLANEYAKTHDIKLMSLTVEHGLRDNSRNQAKELNQLLLSHQIHHEIDIWQKDNEITSNIEAQAREARYKLIINYAKEHNIDLVLLGHHYDDQIENFLIRLERGSGIDGLSLMDSYFSKQKVNFMRPLIAVRKTELKSYLEVQNIKWFEDPSNQDTKFKRNKIRNLLANLDDDLIKQRIYQTSSHFSRVKSYLSAQVNTAYQKLIWQQDKIIIIELAEFKKLHSEIALRLLIKILSEIGGKSYKPRFEKLEILYNKIVNDEINKRTTFAFTIIEVKADQLMFQQEFK